MPDIGTEKIEKLIYKRCRQSFACLQPLEHKMQVRVFIDYEYEENPIFIKGCVFVYCFSLMSLPTKTLIAYFFYEIPNSLLAHLSLLNSKKNTVFFFINKQHFFNFLA